MTAADAPDVNAEPTITTVLDERSSIVELSVAGTWSRRLQLRAADATGKCLASHPAGLLLDLLGLVDPRPASTSQWFAAAALGHRMVPPVPVVACVREESALAAASARRGARYRLPLYPDLLSARAALAERRPLTDQIFLDLRPEPASVASAEQLTAAASRQWDMPSLTSRARLVASELVANAVEHAGTPLQFAVTRRGSRRTNIARSPAGLHLAAYDLEPRLPPLPHGNPPELRPASARGQGLHIVDAAADAWGALPTARGKVVWAALWDRT